MKSLSVRADYILSSLQLVGADGASSFVRQQMLSEVKPRYAGYVPWRGVVPESEADRALLHTFDDHFTFQQMHHSHILCSWRTVRASSGDLDRALGEWESAQLTLGSQLEAQGRMLGNRSQFS